MKPGKFSFFRAAILATLTGFFLYSASVQEIHYMFVNHASEVNEHCNNHLHARENHPECSLCKIDLSSFVQTFSQFELPRQIFSTDCRIYALLEVHIAGQFSANSLRGPPALA
jgi:hypothetical protein